MDAQAANPAILFLPLLTDQQPAVRQQAFVILLATYGEAGLAMLRRLRDAGDPQLRVQARLAIERTAELAELKAGPRPRDGVYVECLGRTRLFVGGEEVRLDRWVRSEHSQIGWQKLQGVLAYLVHCGRQGATRATLEAAVWADAPPATLGRTLLSLRRLFVALGDEGFADQLLTIADQHCLLSPEAYRSDVQTFEQVFDLACTTETSQGLASAAPLYNHALQLYGGPYLIDVSQGAPWARVRRDHLRGSYLIAAERVAEHCFSQGRYEECARACAQVFDSDESADEIVAWLLRAYSRLGHGGHLEHTYRRYLRANALDEASPEGRQDAVVQAYGQLNYGAAR